MFTVRAIPPKHAWSFSLFFSIKVHMTIRYNILISPRSMAVFY
jgi:hypothetical protein